VLGSESARWMRSAEWDCGLTCVFVAGLVNLWVVLAFSVLGVWLFDNINSLRFWEHNLGSLWSQLCLVTLEVFVAYFPIAIQFMESLGVVVSQ
jgi:hypothetical protein